MSKMAMPMMIDKVRVLTKMMVLMLGVRFVVVIMMVRKTRWC